MPQDENTKETEIDAEEEFGKQAAQAFIQGFTSAMAERGYESQIEDEKSLERALDAAQELEDMDKEAEAQWSPVIESAASRGISEILGND